MVMFKKGLAMKMSRGEIVGFAGALGYDYDPETKTISVNEEEAKVVRYIFKRYIEGMGAHVIARELEQMGALTNRGNKSWYDSTVLGIIKNEKYKGDLLQGIDRVKKELKQLDQKMQRLLDMHLEQQIDFGTYEDKKMEIIKEQQLKTTELKRLQGEADVEKDLRKRLVAMRKLLSEAPILKEVPEGIEN